MRYPALLGFCLFHVTVALMEPLTPATHIHHSPWLSTIFAVNPVALNYLLSVLTFLFSCRNNSQFQDWIIRSGIVSNDFDLEGLFCF